MSSFGLPSILFAQTARAESEAATVNEAMIGIVTDNRDPQKLGRVKVTLVAIPSSGGGQDSSWWAPVVAHGAGAHRGWFFIPEVNDEVLVMFEHGNLNTPIVLGALWNGKDGAPATNGGGNPKRLIKSRAGARVLFDDEAGTLIVEDGGGIGRITLSADGLVIEALKGDVCMHAPAGSLRLVGQDIELKAGGNLEIVAGAGMGLSAGAGLTVSAGSLTLSGAPVSTAGGVGDTPMPATSPAKIPDPYKG